MLRHKLPMTTSEEKKKSVGFTFHFARIFWSLCTDYLLRSLSFRQHLSREKWVFTAYTVRHNIIIYNVKCEWGKSSASTYLFLLFTHIVQCDAFDSFLVFCRWLLSHTLLCITFALRSLPGMLTYQTTMKVIYYILRNVTYVKWVRLHSKSNMHFFTPSILSSSVFFS